jgi:hypothetical protein
MADEYESLDYMSTARTPPTDEAASYRKEGRPWHLGRDEENGQTGY